MRAAFHVSVGGVDVTERFNPFLTEIEVRLSAGSAADTARIELADDEGRIILPSVGDPIDIGLGWEETGTTIVFEGVVDDLNSTGGRGQGRMLSIAAKSADMRKAAKQPEETHRDDATLEDVLQRWGAAAGIPDVRVHSDLAGITRDWWGQGNESFMAAGTRIAREIGGTFKILRDRAVMVPRSAGVSATGRPLAPVTAAWGGNLIAWSLSPVLSRPEFRKFRVRWFDTKAARWKVRDVESGTGETAEAEATDRFAAADGDAANDRARATMKEGDRDRGGGSVTIAGEPGAEPEAACLVTGVRPGIDGTYRIETVTQSYSRSAGFTTALDLKQPAGEAGTDDRKPG